MISKDITEAVILESIKKIKEQGIPKKNEIKDYKLVFDEEYYPPKYVIELAYGIIDGSKPIEHEYNSSEAISFLEKLGFKIEENNYWFLAVNPKETSFEEMAFDVEQDYDLYKNGRKRPNFSSVRKNDKIIGYETKPIKKIVCLCEVSRITKDKIYIKKTKDLLNPIDLETLKSNDITKEMVFNKTRGGALSPLKKEQYEEILSMINGEKMANIERTNMYSKDLYNSKNIILRGAPGTGKTYLAKQIAAGIISNGQTNDYNSLTDIEKQQMQFVQFHPNYDYSDFVEGLRPKLNDDGTMGFELKDGIFKDFVEKARKNYENSLKTDDVLEKESSVEQQIDDFLEDIDYSTDTFKTVKSHKFKIDDVDDVNIYITSEYFPNRKAIAIESLRELLDAEEEISQVRDVAYFFGKKNPTQTHSYLYAIYDFIKSKSNKKSKFIVQKEKLKNYVFIIDEINRGEISKIFGELFFAIDPSYRGKLGEVSTQFSNLHLNPEKKFYIPENVYIIGTMNDIDRSVDTFDFAMRRRFRFIELKANEQIEMLNSLPEDIKEEAIGRMTKLNNAISEVEELNDNYQIGASYFLKLKDLTFEQLWSDYLKPLLQEYIQGMYDEEGIMKKFEEAYGYVELNESDSYETGQN